MRTLLGLIAMGLAISVLGWSAVASAKETSPSLIIFNGKIFTSDMDHLYVQALAIRGTRIIAIGDSDAIKALGTARTRRIDLGGGGGVSRITQAHNNSTDPPAQL